MKIGESFFDQLIFEEHNDGSQGSGSAASDNSGENISKEDLSGGEPPESIENKNSDTTWGEAQESMFEEKFQKRIFELAQSNGREISAIDELFKAPEPKVIEKNPYENVDPSIKTFLDYHQETKRGYDDFLNLQKDISAIPDIDLARERVRQETGKDFTNDQVDAYLEKKLNIDLSDLSELDIADQIELTAFVKSVREAKLQEQEKYKQPITSKNDVQTLPADMVELENGERMPRKEYDALVISRQKYVEGIQKSMDSIVPSVFNMVIDDNGSEKTVSYGYDYSKEDVQNMALKANDLEATINSYKNESGEFNHSNLMEDLFWLDKNNRGKALSAIIHKVRAEVTEDLLKTEGNVNLSHRQGTNNIPGAKSGTQATQQQGFGVKFNFNTKN